MFSKSFSLLIVFLLLLPNFIQGQSDYKSALKQAQELGFYEQMDFLVGKKIFDFAGQTLTGEQISNETIKGKVAVINFWFMSCPPCIAELKGLNEMVDQYAEVQGIEFISFTLDTKETLKEDFIPNHEFKFKIIPDSEPFIFEELVHPFGFPTTFVIDKAGKIKKIISGGSTDEAQATKEVKSTLIPLIEQCLGDSFD